MQKRVKILFFSCDVHFDKVIRRSLIDTHYIIASIPAEAQSLRLCLTLQPDLIFIDHQSSACDANFLIPALRAVCQTPIIVLSSQSSDFELVEFLTLGANDYLARPFASDVLIARTQASLRSRAVHVAGAPALINGCLRLDLVRHAVFVANKPVSFTPKEFDLLEYFLLNRGKMLTHRDILRAVWGPAHSDDAIYLRVFIGQIRSKIETCSPHHSMIKSEYGIGYMMEIMTTKVPGLPSVNEAALTTTNGRIARPKSWTPNDESHHSRLMS